MLRGIILGSMINMIRIFGRLPPLSIFWAMSTAKRRPGQCQLLSDALRTHTFAKLRKVRPTLYCAELVQGGVRSLRRSVHNGIWISRLRGKMLVNHRHDLLVEHFVLPCS